MKKWIFLTSFLLASVTIIFFISDIKISDINPFQQKTLTEKTTEKIESISMAQFRSSEYVYKSIFPYDYIYGMPKWGVLIYKDSRFLSEEDKHNLEFYQMCKDIGLNLTDNNYFIIIKTHAVAGFDIGKYLENPVITANEVTKEIILQEPESKILSISFLDSTKSENHPDFKIKPEQWQKLTSILRPLNEQRIIESGILAEADKLNKSFIEEIFITLDWEDVDFK